MPPFLHPLGKDRSPIPVPAMLNLQTHFESPAYYGSNPFHEIYNQISRYDKDRVTVIATLAVDLFVFRGQFHGDRRNWGCPFGDCKENFGDADKDKLMKHVLECSHFSSGSLFCNSCNRSSCLATNNGVCSRPEQGDGETQSASNSPKKNKKRHKLKNFFRSRPSSICPIWPDEVVETASASTGRRGSSSGGYWSEMGSPTVPSSHAPSPPQNNYTCTSTVGELSDKSTSGASVLHELAGSGCSFEMPSDTVVATQLSSHRMWRTPTGPLVGMPVIEQTFSEDITTPGTGTGLTSIGNFGAGFPLQASFSPPSSQAMLGRETQIERRCRLREASDGLQVFPSSSSDNRPSFVPLTPDSYMSSFKTSHQAVNPSLQYNSPMTVTQPIEDWMSQGHHQAPDAADTTLPPFPPSQAHIDPTTRKVHGVATGVDECSECGFRPKGIPDNSRTYLKKQRLNHHQKKKFTCDGCQGKFSRNDNLQKHRRDTCPARHVVNPRVNPHSRPRESFRDSYQGSWENPIHQSKRIRREGPMKVKPVTLPLDGSNGRLPSMLRVA